MTEQGLVLEQTNGIGWAWSRNAASRSGTWQLRRIG